MINLYAHQEQVLADTACQNKVAYYLDMGLGKTFIGSEKIKQLNSPVNLVVCQKSKVQDWVDHFVDHGYESQFKMIYDCTKWDKADWKALEENPLEPCVMVINYDLIYRRSYFAHMTGFTMMLDESSIIQNETAKRSKFILSMKPDNVILLSGTPTAGKYERLWSQLHLLGWGISKKRFWSQYVDVDWVEVDSSGFKIQVVVGYKNVDRLKRKLAQHGAVFMKSDEAFDLPEQIDVPVRIQTTSEYKKFMKDSYIQVEGHELIGDTRLTKRLYARQLCGQYCRAKLEAFEDLVESTGDSLIVFYNFNEELYALEGIVKRLEIQSYQVNGSRKEDKLFKSFLDRAVLFVQYQAGAMGLNLQEKANKAIYFTLTDKSELYEQSKKRIHRIEQDKTCYYYHLICTGSVEEKVLETLKMRKDYTDALFEKDFE